MMPIAMEPGKETEIRLTELIGQDVAAQPEFHARFLTVREQMALDAIMGELRAANEAGDLEKEIDVVVRGLDHVLIGWEKLHDREGNAVPFSACEVLLDVLTLNELFELFGAAQAATTVGEKDLKKPVSPSPSDSENSAADVEPVAESD